MTTVSPPPRETSTNGGAKSPPRQDAEHAGMRASVPPAPKHKYLEDWFQDNPISEVTGETGNVEVIRTFYTSRLAPKSDLNIWYADEVFGFYENVPQRVADLCATHVFLELPKKSRVKPLVEFSVSVWDTKTGGYRPIQMYEFIEKIIYDEDGWEEQLPDATVEWELVFPEGESWGIMRFVRFSDTLGPSRA